MPCHNFLKINYNSSIQINFYLWDLATLILKHKGWLCSQFTALACDKWPTHTTIQSPKHTQKHKWIHMWNNNRFELDNALNVAWTEQHVAESQWAGKQLALDKLMNFFSFFLGQDQGQLREGGGGKIVSSLPTCGWLLTRCVHQEHAIQSHRDYSRIATTMAPSAIMGR